MLWAAKARLLEGGAAEAGELAGDAAGRAQRLAARERRPPVLAAEAGHRLLDRPDPPTAVLAFSDLLALGVMDAAAERGVDVPGRLSVVGFDDIAEAAPAGLTTVRQPHDEKGAAAVRLLLDADDRGSVVLPAELIVRSTTASPRLQERSPCS